MIQCDKGDETLFSHQRNSVAVAGSFYWFGLVSIWVGEISYPGHMSLSLSASRSIGVS